MLQSYPRTTYAFQPQPDDQNRELREFFQTRAVRIALSYAINRQEINDLIFTARDAATVQPIKQSAVLQKLSTLPRDDGARPTEMDAAGYAEGAQAYGWEGRPRHAHFRSVNVKQATVEAPHRRGEDFAASRQVGLKGSSESIKPRI